MSSDFGFWKRGVGEAEEIFDKFAEGDTSDLVVSPDVARFREELLTRWPDVGDVLEPSRFDLEEEPDDAAKYVLLTLSVRQLDYLREILDMAKRNGLVGFSGVAGGTIWAPDSLRVEGRRWPPVGITYRGHFAAPRRLCRQLGSRDQFLKRHNEMLDESDVGAGLSETPVAVAGRRACRRG